MGYDSGFTKVRMKMENQEQVGKYFRQIRIKMYRIIGYDNFYKFETSAVELPLLDNDWTEALILSKVCKLKNYEVDKCAFTYISKTTLKQYINELKLIKLSEHYDLNKMSYEEINRLHDNIFDDIRKLEELYNEFDWDNDTLLFDYTY